MTQHASFLLGAILGVTALHCGGEPAEATATASAGAKGSSGAGTEPSGGSLLPTTPPAPGVILRESFGFAEGLRPHGGKGVAREVFLHESIGDFWIEYLGSKDNQWLVPDGDQSWKFAASTDNPFELPSPLQVTYGNGSVASEWFDPVTLSPSALVPLPPQTVPYQVSLEGYPAAVPGAYLAIGLTNSGALVSNLETSAGVWLVLFVDPVLGYSEINYELRTSGRAGPVLASGRSSFFGWNRLVLRHDPVANVVSARVNDAELGPFPLALSQQRYVGFEGVGIADDFVVRE